MRDPNRFVPFEISNNDSEDRYLTGADFDLESVRKDIHGDLWFGDEAGPFLLHTDAVGRLLEAQIPLPGVKSPENPTLEAGEEPNLPTSKGYEGMAISEDRRFLYPMLEGAVENDAEGRRRIVFEFDLERRRYTGERWEYRTEAPENAIGDLTTLQDHRLLVIERDNKQGEEALFKRVYEVDLHSPDPEGFLGKREVLDLSNVRDPELVSRLSGNKGDIGLGDPFTFPFQTIESLLVLDDGRLLMLNDNNYPLSAGRNPDNPDNTEAIVLLPDGLQGASTTRMPGEPLPGTGGPPLLPPMLLILLSCVVGFIPLAFGRHCSRPSSEDRALDVTGRPRPRGTPRRCNF